VINFVPQGEIAIFIGIWLMGSIVTELGKSYSDLIWPEKAICKHDDEFEIQNS